jgi:hypothetical protein
MEAVQDELRPDGSNLFDMLNFHRTVSSSVLGENITPNLYSHADPRIYATFDDYRRTTETLEVLDLRHVISPPEFELVCVEHRPSAVLMRCERCVPQFMFALTQRTLWHSLVFGATLLEHILPFHWSQ